MASVIPETRIVNVETNSITVDQPSNKNEASPMFVKAKATASPSGKQNGLDDAAPLGSSGKQPRFVKHGS